MGSDWVAVWDVVWTVARSLVPFLVGFFIVAFSPIGFFSRKARMRKRLTVAMSRMSRRTDAVMNLRGWNKSYSAEFHRLDHVRYKLRQRWNDTPVKRNRNRKRKSK